MLPLRKRPYGDWEFEVKDPNGYILFSVSFVVDRSARTRYFRSPEAVSHPQFVVKLLDPERLFPQERVAKIPDNLLVLL